MWNFEIKHELDLIMIRENDETKLVWKDEKNNVTAIDLSIVSRYTLLNHPNSIKTSPL